MLTGLCPRRWRYIKRDGARKSAILFNICGFIISIMHNVIRNFELVKELIDSAKFKAMTDDEKVEAIADCYTKDGKYAKEQMIEEVKKAR